ncbi:MAG: ATP-binding protein [Bacteroidetes bacterium]|nr:ATP-binding protein [Bacteroidota bacterium]
MIPRILTDLLLSRTNQGKALILLGARQIGKTTLVKNLAERFPEHESTYLNCDEQSTRMLLEDTSIATLSRIVGESKLVVIDEAQRVKNIGLTLKLITDNMPFVQLIVTGSSALDISSEINEPLTGRKFEYQMFPVSYPELIRHEGFVKAVGQLEERMVFGMYPEIVMRPAQAQLLLQNLAGSYLYKDLYNLDGIRKPQLLEKLVLALAWQIGHEVSYSELANTLQISKETVSNYIDLLEKAFVVFRLGPFSRNLRNEITTSRKIYFYDTGIRNAVIDNFEPLSKRADVGQLWENFAIAERLKANSYAERFRRNYFWRTHAQQEIDYVEETAGKLFAYEFKWNPAKKGRFSTAFTSSYEVAETMTVTPANFIDFLEKP